MPSANTPRRSIFHEQAAALFDAVGETHEMARTLSGSIQPLLLMGEYTRAFAAGERARKSLYQRGQHLEAGSP